MKRIIPYFSRFELSLWGFSILLITASFLIFDRTSYLSLAASLIGATSLIFCAKGNPIGQVLILLFGLLYGIISYSYAYYGEMITYLGMTVPMAVFALISWIRNPYQGKHSQVKIGGLTQRERLWILPATAAVTVVFYFILKHFGTANLLPSTVSVTTSFFAVYLTARRSPYFALAYAANDVILILLWTLASLTDIHYVSVVACFLAFLLNDLYSFFNWKRMKRSQQAASALREKEKAAVS